jgi:hypothetical protein
MRTRARIPVREGQEICRLDVARSSRPVWAKTSKDDRVFYVRMNNSTRVLPEGNWPPTSPTIGQKADPGAEMLERIESHFRVGEEPDPNSDLVVRGWPLTVDGLLRNADATRNRYSFKGAPLVAISAEPTVGEWGVEAILAGPRLRTRSRYACAPISAVVRAGFELFATFGAPHYSVVLPSYDERAARRLLDVLGEVRPNPFHIGRQP